MTTRDFEVRFYVEQANGTKTLSHKHKETWEKLDLFCPRCGAKTVWRDTGFGDIYVGGQHICASCGGSFYLPDGILDHNCPQDDLRIQCLRNAENNTTTP
jgi:predicted RNA-binding Zn-ribbon protein involved in translation (DUF1610 family)